MDRFALDQNDIKTLDRLAKFIVETTKGKKEKEFGVIEFREKKGALLALDGTSYYNKFFNSEPGKVSFTEKLFKQWNEVVDRFFEEYPSLINVHKKSFEKLEDKISGQRKVVIKQKVNNTVRAKPAIKMQNFQDELNEFIKKPVHFYHSTKSKDGILYWHHTELDFTLNNFTELGVLTTEISISNYYGTKKVDYIIKLVREMPTDSILLLLRSKRGIDPIYHCIFDKTVEHDDCVSGLIYHEDWKREWRLSGCLLSFDYLANQKETGPLSPDESLDIQKIWNQMFKKENAKVIFEDFKLPEGKKETKKSTSEKTRIKPQPKKAK